ncbi:putative transcriptional regulator, MarR family [Nocardia nova SH22a]|uniref:Putative transcriptional regulator, MarR family n=1 Tax=Nocardia nova SH22a TaxID=1415166 RepID=W5TU94_9NOCA|nr:MarR family winged helix-turn-helix transcriptional regulator [Nocardia nova]AHH20776.1 putative transcriptional regulator, MarR family [Nocardia nova SH22a]
MRPPFPYYEWPEIEQALWQTVLTFTTRLPAVLDSELGREHSITHFEYRVLSVLAAAPDRRLRLKVLAQQTDASLSRLSHVIRKLGNRGWLTRIGRQRDVDAALTDTGLAVVEKAAPTAHSLARHLVLDALTPDEAVQLLALLKTATASTASPT